jgi:biotin-(acetyl-CoA carboxylase) ligase
VRTREDEFPSELRDIATSLAAATARDADRDELLEALLDALEHRLASPAAEILDAWRERDALREAQVRWRDGEGTARGVSESGALIVESNGQHLELDAGEVHLLR